MSNKVAVILFVGLTAGLCMHVTAHAAILYVDKDYACPGNGSSATPYCSIQNAFNVVNAGDTIRIRDSATPYDENAILTRSGTSSGRILIEPDSGHNPILRLSGSTLTGAIDLRNVSYVTVQNLTFDGNGINTSDAALILRRMTGSMTGISILGNTFKNWGGTSSHASTAKARAALFLNGGWCDSPCDGQISNTLIQGNTFNSNRQAHIQMMNASNSVIESNTFIKAMCGKDSDTATNTQGIKLIHGASAGSTRNIIRNNVFRDWEPQASCGVAHTSGSWDTSTVVWCDVNPNSGVIEGNLIYNINYRESTPSYFESSGIYIEHKCHSWVVQNNVIYNLGHVGIKQRMATTTLPASQYLNNTIYNVGNKGFRIMDGKSVIKNNIVFDAATAQITFDTAQPGLHDIDYNLYFDSAGGNKVGQWGAPTVNFANWKSACACDSHSINANPQFLNAPLGDFHLLSTSQAQGTGLGGVDMGAYPDIGSVELDAPTGLRIVVP
jgi:hypothetical protein